MEPGSHDPEHVVSHNDQDHPTPPKVILRIRPLLSREGPDRLSLSLETKDPKHHVLKVNTERCPYSKKTGEQSYPFSSIYDSTSFTNMLEEQETIVRAVNQDILDCLDRGYNLNLLSYGMTESGKSHTLYGPSLRTCRGVIPALISTLLEKKRKAKTSLHLSMCALTGETVRDLFVPGSGGHGHVLTQVKSHATLGSVILDCTRVQVSSWSDFKDALELGLQAQAIAHVRQHLASSTSILVLRLFFPSGGASAQHVDFFDLPGNDSYPATALKELDVHHQACPLPEERLYESISSLDQYFESTQEDKTTQERPVTMLMKLLEDAFIQGNSKSIILAHISPSVYRTPETLRTLDLMKSVQQKCNKSRTFRKQDHDNRHHRSQFCGQMNQDQIVSMLQHEIHECDVNINGQTTGRSREISNQTNMSAAKVRDVLAREKSEEERRIREIQVQKDWLTRVLLNETKHREIEIVDELMTKWIQTRQKVLGSLPKIGLLAQNVNGHQNQDEERRRSIFPCLVHLHANAAVNISEFVVCYPVNEIETTCGSDGLEQDLVLFGIGALSRHCVFRYKDAPQRLEIIAHVHAHCSVNGEELLASIPYALNDGDRVILGASDVFQVHMSSFETTSLEEATWAHRWFDAIHEYCTGVSSSSSFALSNDDPSTTGAVHEQALINSNTMMNTLTKRVQSMVTLHERHAQELEDETEYDDQMTTTTIMLQHPSLLERVKKGRVLSNTMIQKELLHGLIQQRIDDRRVIQLMMHVKELNLFCLYRPTFEHLDFEIVPVVQTQILHSMDDPTLDPDELYSSVWIRQRDEIDFHQERMWSCEEFRLIFQLVSMMDNNHEEEEIYSRAYPETAAGQLVMTTNLPEEFFQSFHYRNPAQSETDQVIGVCHLRLNALNYLMSIEHERVPIISPLGTARGFLNLSIHPYLEQHEPGNPQKTFRRYVQENIDLEEEHLEDYLRQRIQIRVQLHSLEGLPESKSSNTMIQYRFLNHDNDSDNVDPQAQVFRTDRSHVRTTNPIFGQEFQHEFMIDDELIESIMTQVLEIEVYGNQSPLVISNRQPHQKNEGSSSSSSKNPHSSAKLVRRLQEQLLNEKQHGNEIERTMTKQHQEYKDRIEIQMKTLQEERDAFELKVTQLILEKEQLQNNQDRQLVVKSQNASNACCLQ